MWQENTLKEQGGNEHTLGFGREVEAKGDKEN